MTKLHFIPLCKRWHRTFLQRKLPLSVRGSFALIEQAFRRQGGVSEAALERAEQELRVFLGGAGELLQKRGVLLAARGIAAVELRRA